MARRGGRGGRSQSFTAGGGMDDFGLPGTTNVKIEPMHPLRRAMIQLCFLINTIGAFLMSVGWWNITGSSLDGALTTLVIICGVVGIVLVTMNRE